MIRSYFTAITLLTLTASNVDAVDRQAVTTVKPLLVTAIDQGEAHGVLVGQAAQYIAQTFKSAAPIEIDVKTVQPLGEPGCKRLAVTTSQDGVVDFNRDFSTLTNTGHLIVAANIAAFADVPTFKAKVDEIWELMKSSPLLPGFDEIRLPGERSAKIYADRTTNGVPITPELQSALDQLADRLNIARL